MYCDRCKKEESSVHLTEIIKNIRSEIHLCENCAKEIGLNSKLTSFSLSLPDMLSFLDVEDIDNSGYSKTCSSCGHTAYEFKKNGVLGCPDCYFQFSDIIGQYLSQKSDIHSHQGKIPHNYINTINVEKIVSHENNNNNHNLKWLSDRMDEAVQLENYEEAARLRDIIKSLKLAEIKQ